MQPVSNAYLIAKYAAFAKYAREDRDRMARALRNRMQQLLMQPGPHPGGIPGQAPPPRMQYQQSFPPRAPQGPYQAHAGFPQAQAPQGATGAYQGSSPIGTGFQQLQQPFGEPYGRAPVPNPAFPPSLPYYPPPSYSSPIPPAYPPPPVAPRSLSHSHVAPDYPRPPPETSVGYQPPATGPSQPPVANNLSHPHATTNSSYPPVAPTSHPPATTTSPVLTNPPPRARITPVISPQPLEGTQVSTPFIPLILSRQVATSRPTPTLTPAPAPAESSEPVPVKASKMSRRAFEKRPRPSPGAFPGPSKRTEVIPPFEIMDSDIEPLSGNELPSAVTDNEGGDEADYGPSPDIEMAGNAHQNVGRSEGLASPKQTSEGNEGPKTLEPASGKENQKAGREPPPRLPASLLGGHRSESVFESPFRTARHNANRILASVAAQDPPPALSPGHVSARTRTRNHGRAFSPPNMPVSARRSTRISQQQGKPSETETAEAVRETKAKAFEKLKITTIESNADRMRALIFHLVHGIYFQTRSGTGEASITEARRRLILLASQAIRALLGNGDDALDVICDVWRRDFREELRRPTLDIGPPARRNRETEGLDFCDPGTRVRCSVCGRRHGVEFSVGFAGTPYKSTKEHEPEEMTRGSDSDMPGRPRTTPIRFNVGRRCTELITSYHTLRQWERTLKAWVHERMRELGHRQDGYLTRNFAGGASFELVADIVQRLLEEEAEDGTSKVDGILDELTSTHKRSLDIKKARKGMSLKFRKRHGPGTGKKKGVDNTSATIKEESGQGKDSDVSGTQASRSEDQVGASETQHDPSTTEPGHRRELQGDITRGEKRAFWDHLLPKEPAVPPLQPNRPRIRYDGIGRTRPRVIVNLDTSDEDLPCGNPNGNESSDSDDYVFLNDEDEVEEYQGKKDEWDEGRGGGR